MFKIIVFAMGKMQNVRIQNISGWLCGEWNLVVAL